MFFIDDFGTGGDGKMVTATKKGAAVLDQHIPDHIKQAYHVLQVVCGFVLFFYLLFPCTFVYLCMGMGVHALQFQPCMLYLVPTFHAH